MKIYIVSTLTAMDYDDLISEKIIKAFAVESTAKEFAKDLQLKIDRRHVGFFDTYIWETELDFGPLNIVDFT